MYTLVIGRAYPDEKTGMMGVFEFEQARALRDDGMQVVYAFCDTRSIKSLRKLNNINFEKDGVPIYGCHLPIGGIPRPIFELLKENRFKSILSKVINEQGMPDIIHVHYPLLNLTPKIWSMLKRLDKPIVVTEHWSKVQTQEIESYRVDLLCKIVDECDSFLCVGDPLRKSVIELTKTENQIKVLPNMVNRMFYYEEDLQRNDIYQFIAIGRLVTLKRFDLLIDAYYDAFCDNPNVHLHIVGNGPMYNELKIKIKSLNMDKKITMHGFLPRAKTAQLMKKCSAYVSASVLETFGVPFIEALACGKPVIGIKGGALDGYFTEEVGLQFIKDDIKSLTNVLKEMFLKQNEYSERYISNYAENVFSEKAIVSSLKVVYLSCIKSH